MSSETRVRLCGVELQETESTRALVEAIEADNDDITVRHVPGLVKIQSPKPLVIKRESVEARLGRSDSVLEWTADFSGGPETFRVEAHNDCGSRSVTWTLSPVAVEEPTEPAADAVEDEPLADAPDAAVDATDIPVDGPVDVTTDAVDWTFDSGADESQGPGATGDCGCFMAA